MVYYGEVRPGLKRNGRLKFVPVDELDKHVGFRSVYSFDLKTAEQLAEQGHMRDLDSVSVYSETLLLDFDDCPQSAKEFGEFLRKNNYNHEELTSGNRSVHFHVEIEPMWGPQVPAFQKHWVKEHAPKADVSFYHKCGMYRLTNTFHNKNPGHRKLVLDGLITGDKLKIPEHIDATVFTKAVVADDDYMTNQRVLTGLMMRNDIGPGERTPTMYKILNTMINCGRDYNFILDELLYWNKNNCSVPHPDEYVEQWAEESYKKVMR